MRWIRRIAVALGLFGLVATGLTGMVGTAAAGSGSGTVLTDKGLVQGVVSTDHRSFQGIPYAAPPVGNLRWKSPQQAAPWSGTLDATQPKSECAQPAALGFPTTYNEDCLYLNVTTPANPTGLLPVMVFFHGGGYLSGNGYLYDPTKLAVQGNAIVVTINYRLGAFGFLATPGLSAETPGIQSGNYGIEDQQAALRWVQRNAAAFGGNPTDVTIFGQSAGASSVCVQLASPTAAGLFQRAIVESGSCDFPMRTKQDAESAGTTMATSLGCTDPATVTACLRGKSPQDLLTAWGPNGEPPVVGGLELPFQPAQALQTGMFNHVPLIMGNAEDEERLFVGLAFDLQGNPVTPAEYVANIQQLYGANANQVLALYPLANYSSPSIALATVLTDGGWNLLSTCSTLTSDHLATGSPLGVPVYAYQFQDRTAPPLVPIPNFPTGAEHTSELPYLFTSVPLGQPLNADQQQLSDTMVQYWTTFARTGNPNGGSAPSWPQFHSDSDVLSLNLGANGIHPFNESTASNCSFWDSIPSITTLAL